MTRVMAIVRVKARTGIPVKAMIRITIGMRG